MENNKVLKDHHWYSVWEHLLRETDLMGRVVPFTDIKETVFECDPSVEEPVCSGSGRYIVGCLDAQRKLTLTFCAMRASCVGAFAVQLALGRMEQLDSTGKEPGEYYRLPDIWIIDLTSTLPARTVRTVNLNSRQYTAPLAILNVRVQHIDSCMPGVNEAAYAQTMDEARRRVHELYDGLVIEGEERRDILECCALLADPRLYDPDGGRDVVINSLLLDEPEHKPRGQFIEKMDLT